MICFNIAVSAMVIPLAFYRIIMAVKRGLELREDVDTVLGTGDGCIDGTDADNSAMDKLELAGIASMIF